MCIIIDHFYDNNASTAETRASIEDLLLEFNATLSSLGTDSATAYLTLFSIVSFHGLPCDLKQSAILSDHFLLLLNSLTSILTPNC